MPSDKVQDMIATALAGSGPDEPLDQTARRIFLSNVDDLTEPERAAFEVTGFESIKLHGPPDFVEIGSVLGMIEAGRPYARTEVDDAERSRLALVGFVALVAEQAKV